MATDVTLLPAVGIEAAGAEVIDRLKSRAENIVAAQIHGLRLGRTTKALGDQGKVSVSLPHAPERAPDSPSTVYWPDRLYTQTTKSSPPASPGGSAAPQNLIGAAVEPA